MIGLLAPEVSVYAYSSRLALVFSEQTLDRSLFCSVCCMTSADKRTDEICQAELRKVPSGSERFIARCRCLGDKWLLEPKLTAGLISMIKAN